MQHQKNKKQFSVVGGRGKSCEKPGKKPEQGQLLANTSADEEQRLATPVADAEGATYLSDFVQCTLEPAPR